MAQQGALAVNGSRQAKPDWADQDWMRRNCRPDPLGQPCNWSCRAKTGPRLRWWS